MKEFMLLIRTQGDHLAELSPEQEQQHVGKVMNYMNGLETVLSGLIPDSTV